MAMDFVKKRAALLLILLLFHSRTVFSAHPAKGEDRLSAVITSDLHYARNGTTSDTIVSGMAFSEEITDAMIAQVIDLHPDVFIMTGDNTNSGNPEDMAALAEKLKTVKNAGIQILMTTGNHDLNRCTPTEYEKTYFPLFEPKDRDPFSLSYTALSGDFAFLVMDDNTYTSGRMGLFKEETVSWIEKMCRKYASKHILFLSHHNVIPGKGEESSRTYRIQNENLPELLRANHVLLCLTGHIHSQTILEENSLYEIISSMPFGDHHLLGFLYETADGLDYHAESIDFSAYGEDDLSARLAEKDKEKSDQIKNSIGRIAENGGYSGRKKEGIVNLFSDFFTAYSSGCLGDMAEEIKENEFYEDMIRVLWDKNYGPWMAATLENPPLNATRLFVPFD